MRLQTQGLGEGFLAGFRTMADYQSQQKADARADKTMTLQEKEQAETSDYRKKTWDHGLEVEKKLDTRYEEEKGYNRKQKEREFALNEKQTYAQMANDSARTGIARQSANLQAKHAEQQSKITAMQISALESQQFTQDNWGLLRGGWNNITNGKPVTEQQAAVLSDPRAGAMNVNKYTDKAYVSAVTGLQSNVSTLMSSFKPEQFHSPEFYSQLNSPQMKQQMSVVFKDEIKRNVGYVDASGKKVVDKEFGGIVPQQDGSLALEVVPVYEDGSKGEAQPVTVNRSNDPNDQVRTFAPSDIVGVINSRANIAKAIKNPETLLQDIGVAPAPDVKGYRKEVADATTNTNKAKAKIDLEASKGNIDPAKATELKAIEDAGLQKTLESYKSVYGLEDAANQGRLGNQDNTPARLVTEWVGSDPQKQQYVRALVAAGQFDPQNGDAALLDQQYQAYLKEQKSKTLEAAALQEKVKAAQQNQTRY